MFTFEKKTNYGGLTYAINESRIEFIAYGENRIEIHMKSGKTIDVLNVNDYPDIVKWAENFISPPEQGLPF